MLNEEEIQKGEDDLKNHVKPLFLLVEPLNFRLTFYGIHVWGNTREILRTAKLLRASLYLAPTTHG